MPPARPRHALLLGFAVVLASVALKPIAARAEIGASATLESDFRYRGVSLTDDKPDLKLGLTYDHPSGAYAGIGGVLGGGVGGGLQTLGYVGYAGMAVRGPYDLTWDFGISDTHIGQSVPLHRLVLGPGGVLTQQTFKKFYHADYSEAYVGVIRNRLSVRLYYSPHYFSRGSQTAYLDLGYAIRPAERWRLFAHAGALFPLGGQIRPSNKRLHYDLRAGAALEFRRGELQLAWTHVGPHVEYPAGRVQHDALVISTSVFY